eukprot:CAMPEP_0178439022 /NCGR_PEP_ID=MMETSP0689_2-20121128/35923_1 /TAXON_ID=160604 /ORGANISM="Amphidinium massartii, Strain CS-259" /LENGTH=577 /DNA_ID=CAMNT_0020061501 /DNA_START=176 /DNA_END=1909 /DNA_ORIENTATION=+
MNATRSLGPVAPLNRDRELLGRGGVQSMPVGRIQKRAAMGRKRPPVSNTPTLPELREPWERSVTPSHAEVRESSATGGRASRYIASRAKSPPVEAWRIDRADGQFDFESMDPLRSISAYKGKGTTHVEKGIRWQRTGSRLSDAASIDGGTRLPDPPKRPESRAQLEGLVQRPESRMQHDGLASRPESRSMLHDALLHRPDTTSSGHRAESKSHIDPKARQEAAELAQVTNRLAKMTLQEAPQFFQSIAGMVDVGVTTPKQSGVLHQTMQKRLAELCNTAKLTEVSSAGQVLQQWEEFTLARAPELRKVLEGRMTFLLHHLNGSSSTITPAPAEVLHMHMTKTMELRKSGFVSNEIYHQSLAQSRSAMERYTPEELLHNVPKVWELANLEPSLLECLDRRLLKLSQRPLREPKQLNFFLTVVARYVEVGMKFENTLLQETLQQRVLSCMEEWPRKALEILIDGDGGLLRLCKVDARMHATVQESFANRLVEAMNTTLDLWDGQDTLHALREAVGVWLRLAKRAMGAGALVISDATRRDILVAASRFTERCVDHVEIADAMKDAQALEWSIVVMVGGHA